MFENLFGSVKAALSAGYVCVQESLFYHYCDFDFYLVLISLLSKLYFSLVFTLPVNVVTCQILLKKVFYNLFNIGKFNLNFMTVIRTKYFIYSFLFLLVCRGSTGETVRLSTLQEEVVTLIKVH